MNNIYIKYLYCCLLFLVIFSQFSCNNRHQRQALVSSKEKIHDLVTAYHERGHFDGTILVADSSGIIYKGTFGLADRTKNLSLTTESQFYLASVSKQFTSTAILLLLQSEKITLQDRVVKYLPELPDIYKTITIENLLNHTSGIPDYYNFVKLFNGFSNADVLNVLLSVDKLEFEPGTQYRYSNSGYVLLSLLVDRISGLNFADFLSENAFKKAELNQTVVFDENAEPLKNRVIGYAVDGTLTDYQYRTTGGGGIFSNVEDLYLWHKILSNGDLLEERVLEMAYKPTILENDSFVYYGAGWKIDPLDPEHVFHTGTLEGFRTYFDRHLNNDQVIIILSNNSSGYLKDIVDKIKVSFSQSYQE